MVNTLALMVSSSLTYSAPMIFAAIGGVFSERSGTVNVGLEGTMVIGAFAAAVTNLGIADVCGAWTPWIGMLVGGLAGMLFSLIHAVATVNFRANHVISGTVLNLAAPSLTVFLTRILFEGKGQTDMLRQSFGKFTFPFLSKIPVIGNIFFKATSLPAYVGILVAVISWFVLNKTKFGLRLRSVGEHPLAADTLGIDVYKMRYAGILISGFLAGMGGAVLVQSISLTFNVSTISGQGFMAMAAMIFGRWSPIGATLAAIFFGFAQSLAVIGSSIPVIKHIQPVYLQIFPYVITILVLIFFAGKTRGPAASGTTYVKSK